MNAAWSWIACAGLFWVGLACLVWPETIQRWAVTYGLAAKEWPILKWWTFPDYVVSKRYVFWLRVAGATAILAAIFSASILVRS